MREAYNHMSPGLTGSSSGTGALMTGDGTAAGTDDGCQVG